MKSQYLVLNKKFFNNLLKIKNKAFCPYNLDNYFLVTVFLF